MDINLHEADVVLTVLRKEMTLPLEDQYDGPCTRLLFERLEKYKTRKLRALRNVSA